jgi:hypothetical protein
MQQRRKIAMLEMTRLGTVWGFTRDERFVLGEAALGTVTTSTVVAWDATTGRVARHRDALDTSRELDEVTVAFFDEVDLKMYLVAFVVDPENDVHRLVFDDECWAGPARRLIAARVGRADEWEQRAMSGRSATPAPPFSRCREWGP